METVMSEVMLEKKSKSSLRKLADRFNVKEFKTLNEIITFDEYYERVVKNPKLVRTAYQRIYDMILSKGTKQINRYRKTVTTYNFFSDPDIPIFGLENTLEELVKFIRGAAGGFGTEKRVLLLHGPVGSSKSTICRLLKRGMEKYSRTDEGAWYTHKWVNLPTEGETGIYTHTEDECPMHEEPLKLVPLEVRKAVFEELNENLMELTSEADKEIQYSLKVEGELCPRCKKFMHELMLRNDGDWQKVVEKHIRVVRCVYSEADRRGIGTFQPKDEKNQDATELTGDINFSKIGQFGSDSDPRAFNFDGEFCVANRGLVEFIEMLKLDQAFLYDLLGASQERQIKPKKFSQVSIDEAIIGHSNNPEYEKLKENKSMEAFRDRTVKIDVPYLLRWDDEIKVLEQDYAPDKVRQHVAPHTLEIAALWAILTRLEEDKNVKLTLVEKAELYNGKSLPNYTEDSVWELHERYHDEGMKSGVSARYTQDKIANCLATHHNYINPFMVMNEIERGLNASALITNKDEIGKYLRCADLAKKKLENILKREVQQALVGDDKAAQRLCTQYIDNLMAYIKKTKIKDVYTGKDQEPNERLMREIEEKIDIPEPGADDFRRMIAGFIGGLHHSGQTFVWNSNVLLQKAFEKKLFEDVKDTIKLSVLNQSGATVVDPEVQEKIDALKGRLIKQYGYNEASATDVLNFCSSIFSRGDPMDDE